MQLELNQALIDAAVNENINKAVCEALGGYEVKQGIAKAISSEVADGVLADAIKKAVSQLNLENLSCALAKEIEKAATRATVSFLQEGLVTAVCKLRGIGDYSPDDEKKREAVKAELFS
jgi:hypothetical protein